MKYWLASSLMLLGCSQPSSTSAADKRDVIPATSAAEAGPAPEDYVAKIKGKFELWQNDRGEDGQMCDVALLGSRTIGGYRIKPDEGCLRKIGIEDLSAWFVTDSDEFMVLIDSTRKVIARLKRDENGYYYFGSDEFYLSRSR